MTMASTKEPIGLSSAWESRFIPPPRFPGTPPAFSIRRGGDAGGGAAWFEKDNSRICTVVANCPHCARYAKVPGWDSFQNVYLLERLSARLREECFEVFPHSEVPAGDGGLSLGQALVTAHQLGR